MKSKFLIKYVYENPVDEINKLNNKNLLIIPLGRAVEGIINNLVEKNIIEEGRSLKGFPHPSGANVNRIIQLEENKKELIKFIMEFWHDKI